MQTYSAEYKSTLASLSPPEMPVVLLEIDHPDLSTPVRVCNDTQNLTSNGNQYIAVPFRFVLPDDVEQQAPRARLAIDNIGRELMQWIESSAGGQGSTVRVMQVMPSRPNQIEWEISMNLTNVQATMAEVSAEIAFENLLSRTAVNVAYRPDTHPGVF